MLLCIDETGAFQPSGNNFSFFVSTQIRQRRSLYKQKISDFLRWERSLPRNLKDHKGEFKSRALSDRQLLRFVQQVVCPNPPLLITPVGVRASDNPPHIITKHQHSQWQGIRKGYEWYRDNDRPQQANTYEEFSFWFKKLSYTQFMKIGVLGECIVHSIINAIGHSVTGRYDNELPRMRFIIDRDIVNNPRANIFWHELMRNQLYNTSKRHPIPLLNTWRKKSHPFLQHFTRAGELDFNELFWNQLAFDVSHRHPELRMADIVAGIFGRYFNRRGAADAYFQLKRCIARDGKIQLLQLEDFNLNA